MKRFKDFEINIISLKPGHYDFEFEFDNSFFKNFEESLVDEGEGKVKLSMERAETFIQLDFEIQGTIRLICDRSLDPYDQEISSRNEILLKYADEAGEIDDEIVLIEWGTPTINIAQFIYEFISLQIPMKKLHPRYEEQEIETEDEIVFQSESEDEVEEENSNWKNELKKLIDKEENNNKD